MVEETLRILEYDKVRTILSGFTVTGPGRELALALLPLDGRQQVERCLAEVDEARLLLEESGRPPLGGCRDLRQPLLEVRAEGTFLAPEALLCVASSMAAAIDCRRYYAGVADAPLLADVAGRLVALKEELAQIRECIGDRGEILDSASFELGEIRVGMRRLRQRIKRTLEGLLNSERLAGVFQERIITERGGRYVVPVRADHRGQIKGFIHDESASGQTLFLEPAQVLEENNRLRALQREEQREQEKVLRRLSAMVRRHAPSLAANQELLARLDLRTAAGHFSRASDGCAVKLEARRLVELKGARHPLLLFERDGTKRPEGAVPIDLHLPEERDALIISGPNTGGKTVAIKTLGLLQLMIHSGLHVPCQPGSRVHLFGRLFADIGDEQSIEASLSTFSGHMSRMVRILEAAGADSLVLLDEAGTGTDPAEGGALALAVLDTLRRRGAKAVVTTHLNLVKGYAQLQEAVENAAVEFDSETFAPTYRLHYGIPGASSAFAIARLLGLPEEVLQRAGDYLGDDEREGLQLIEKLNSLQSRLERQLAEAQELKRQAQQERQKRKRLLTELEEGRGALLEKTRLRGEQMVRDAERKVKDLMRQVSQEGGAGKKAQASKALREVREMHEELGRMRPQPKRLGKAPTSVEPGEMLWVTALQAEARVVEQRGLKVDLDLKGKKLRLPLAGLEQFSPPRFSGQRGGRPAVTSSVERSAFNPRLMLVGRRAEDALSLLERFLDDALLQGVSEVEIVHGAGEGILRRSVREALAQHRAVTAFYAAPQDQGGDNVTLAELGE